MIITGKVRLLFLPRNQGVTDAGQDAVAKLAMVLLVDADLWFLRAWNVRTAQGVNERNRL